MACGRGGHALNPVRPEFVIMAHDHFGFGPYAAALFQGVTLAAHGVAFDAIGRTGLITQGGGHQAHVVDHHRVAVGAHGLGHAGSSFQISGDGAWALLVIGKR